MSQDKKYQVFISSTYTDLVEARNAVINTVLESYNFPVGMEYFGADNDEQWSIIKDLIDSSDYYILILGHRYGSISKADGISFTEKEFDYAVQQGVKLLCFVRQDNVATLPHERDDASDKKEGLAKFRAKVLDNRLCEFWDNVEDLKHKVSHSLYKNIRRHGGIGWVRGNLVSGVLAEEMAKLSEENRKLREENLALKESVSIKKPSLKLSINNITNMPLNEDDALELFWYTLREDYHYEKPLKISKSINQERSTNYGLVSIGLPNINRLIDEYNKDIDSITELQIAKHNNALRKLGQIELKSLPLKIMIENIGLTLANRLSLEIEFPEFITIIDDDSVQDIKNYKKKLEKELIPKIITPEERQHDIFGRSFDGPLHNIQDLMPPISKKRNAYTSENIIYISEDALLHSRQLNLNNFILIPNAIGEGQVSVNLMCAEYDQPVTFSFPIRVTE